MDFKRYSILLLLIPPLTFYSIKKSTELQLEVHNFILKQAGQKILQNQTGLIKLINVSKKYDSTSSGLAGAQKGILNKWNLQNKQIIEIFKTKKIISGTEVDLNYENLPYCYFGKITINGKVMNFRINAGAYGILYSKGGTPIYYAVPKKFYKYFLSTPQ